MCMSLFSHSVIHLCILCVCVCLCAHWRCDRATRHGTRTSTLLREGGPAQNELFQFNSSYLPSFKGTICQLAHKGRCTEVHVKLDPVIWWWFPHTFMSLPCYRRVRDSQEDAKKSMCSRRSRSSRSLICSLICCFHLCKATQRRTLSWSSGSVAGGKMNVSRVMPLGSFLTSPSLPSFQSPTIVLITTTLLKNQL